MAREQDAARRLDGTLFYDATLLEALEELQAMMGTRLQQLGQMARIEPAGLRTRAAFSAQPQDDEGYALLWHHDTERQRTLQTTPDWRARPKATKARYVERTIWPMAGRLMIANRLRIKLTRTCAVWLDEPSLGSVWCPVRSVRADAHLDEMAWAAWLNSTPGIVSVLARRTRDLSYAAFPLALLRSIPFPDRHMIDTGALIETFEKLQNIELEGLAQIDRDEARAELDEAAGQVAKIDGLDITRWREAIAREPSVRT